MQAQKIICIDEGIGPQTGRYQLELTISNGYADICDIETNVAMRLD